MENDQLVNLKKVFKPKKKLLDGIFSWIFLTNLTKIQRNLGDRWIGIVTQGIEWATPKDHLFQLDYPKVNDDTVVTYIAINCTQVSLDEKNCENKTTFQLKYLISICSNK